MKVHGRRLRRSEAGASSSEYAILVSLIAIVVLGSIALVGTNLGASYKHSCDSIAATQSTTC